MRDLEKAKWIWQNRENTPDEYVEFSFCFAMPKNKKAIFNIAADSNYVLYINGQIAAFGQYADYPPPRRGIFMRLRTVGFRYQNNS